MGMGKYLVNIIEKMAVEAGCKHMKLYNLVPTDGRPHPFKDFLGRWYESFGYVWQSTIPYASLEPEGAAKCAYPCKFNIYLKSLTSSTPVETKKAPIAVPWNIDKKINTKAKVSKASKKNIQVKKSSVKKVPAAKK